MPPSRKEQEILEKQRQLAARLKPGRPAHPQKPKKTSSSSSSTSTFGKAVTSSKTKEPFVIDLTSGKAKIAKLPKITKKPSPPPPPPPKPLKRPTLKNKRPSVKSVPCIMAAARANAKFSQEDKKSQNANDRTAKATAGRTIDSPRVKRKSSTKSFSTTSVGALAKLVKNASNGTQARVGADGATTNTAASLQTVEPDDFWKDLRAWDFFAQYQTQFQQQKRNKKKEINNNNDKNNNENALDGKPLPNLFLNPRHYMAAWAPLCMAECRAQLIQEAAQNHSQPVPVTVTSGDGRSGGGHRRGGGRGGGGRGGEKYYQDAPWMEGNETGCYVTIRPQQQRGGGNDGDWKFFPHDLCLLVLPQYKDLLQQMERGHDMRKLVQKPGEYVNDDDDTPASFAKCALIGHVESSRAGLNGLVLKVSKQRWASVGQKNMHLVKLGSNVTALREFTALTRVDLLPLKRFLLGQHLTDGHGRRSSNCGKRKEVVQQSTQKLLEKMGGSQALGTGFISYAQKKFNTSQLAAIAAAANEYGEGGFTLIKGPPGTGKTTTLAAILNSLHIRQYNKYYEEVRRIAALSTGARQHALEMARKAKPRLLVCAPSNAAVDNIILKIMQDGFVDGQGNRYNPSIIRVGVGQSSAVRAVALETKVDSILENSSDLAGLEASISGYRSELQHITTDIAKLRRRILALSNASPWPLSKDWEIRVDEESFDETGRVYFVNHITQTTTYEVPPPPEPNEAHFPATSMPEYRSFLSRIVKLVENYFRVKMHLERCTIVKGGLQIGANHFDVKQNLEAHVLNSVHIVMTTLGTSGGRVLEAADKFEVVVCDEAAQSVEPAILSALQLGSRHAVLVGDPQQLPATIFNVSGRNTKFDRSLFQRLEEAGQPVYMLTEQYRMHPKISHFPRHIFYGGDLLDGPNVIKPDYGNPLRQIITNKVSSFKPFTILDLDSREERGGTSLANNAEAVLAVHLYRQLKEYSHGLSVKSRIAVITPYAQQARMLKQQFHNALGPTFEQMVEVSSVDAFQGREANIVIFSAVRASDSGGGIGFLSDVRRMNVALTRAKHFLFVIARCQSIVVNPYWKDLVQHARETQAVVRVPLNKTSEGGGYNRGGKPGTVSIKNAVAVFGNLVSWLPENATQNSARPFVVGDPRKQPPPAPLPGDPRKRPRIDR